MLENTLFGSEFNNSDVIQYNACVGNNGSVGMYSYIDGFQSSTVILLESLIKGVDKENFDGFMWCLDTCVYPILFSARHFLELFLKQQILKISFLKNKNKHDEIIQSLKTHDINKLWNMFLVEVKAVCDIRLDKYLNENEMNIFILQFHDIDQTGETFRYPYNQTDSLHLTDHSVIGLKRFYTEFLEFSKVASGFSSLTSYLLQEYKVGTYTEHLSREDIEKIALLLPKKNNWNSLTLKSHQLDVKTKYKAGSREFRKVLEIIRGNIEFNNIVSDEYNLGVSEEKLIKFCLNCLMKKQQNLYLEIKELAWIRSIQEISISGSYFSEDVHYLVDSYYEEYKNYNEYALKEELVYVYRNLFRTIKGLIKLKQMNTIEKIHKVFLNMFVSLIYQHKNEPKEIKDRPYSLKKLLGNNLKNIVFQAD